MGSENCIPSAQEDTPDIIAMTRKIHSVTAEIVQYDFWFTREYRYVSCSGSGTSMTAKGKKPKFEEANF